MKNEVLGSISSSMKEHPIPYIVGVSAGVFAAYKLAPNALGYIAFPILGAFVGGIISGKL